MTTAQQPSPATAALAAFNKAAANHTRRPARIRNITENGSISAYVFDNNSCFRAFFPADGSISTWSKVS